MKKPAPKPKVTASPIKKVPGIKTDWNLKLLYVSQTDPQIEKDLAAAEALYDAFAKKYSVSSAYLASESELAKALADYEKLAESPLGVKPYLYFNYLHDLKSGDTKVEAKLSLIADRYAKNANKIVFFGVALARISESDQQKFLASKELAQYQYFLKTTFDQAKYTLSEAEEKILNLKYLPAHELWIRGSDRILNRQQIVWKGKKIPITEAIGKIPSLGTAERRALHALVCKQLRSIADFAEGEMNAIVIDKKINDEIRGYEKPYSAVVLQYQNESATVEALVKTVSEHFAIGHRFYKLKAKMLKQKSLLYSDRAARVGTTTKQIPFDEAVSIVERAFRKVDPAYADTLLAYLKNGQVDVFPNTGKRGGAFCSSCQNLPTFLLLNHLPNFESVLTLAHEMGHALHSKYSFENNTPAYRDYTTSTAEVASTLFENFVFDEVFPLLSPKEQVVALHDRINGSVQTIFRQIACFNFELELHTQIRAKGSVSKEEMGALMNKHMKSYLGPLFRFTDDDGYFFVYWSHIRRFFYVYSYALGELVSNAMYLRYTQDASYASEIKKFLSAGGSDSPENIWASVGINVRDPNFFKDGLKKIEEDIKKLEKLLGK